MLRGPGALALVLATAACTSGPVTQAQSAPPPSPSAVRASTPSAGVPAGTVLATTAGSGSRELGTVVLERAGSLFFRCTAGEGAVLRYGGGAQPCPDGGALLSIDRGPEDAPVTVSVEAPADVSWLVSGTSDEVAPTQASR